MVEEWKWEPEFKAAYDELEMEFTLLSELCSPGRRPAEVAEKMGTKPPAVTRLETALSEALTDGCTLKKYG
jgi:hypothetical protein